MSFIIYYIFSLISITLNFIKLHTHTVNLILNLSPLYHQNVTQIRSFYKTSINNHCQLLSLSNFDRSRKRILRRGNSPRQSGGVPSTFFGGSVSRSKLSSFQPRQKLEQVPKGKQRMEWRNSKKLRYLLQRESVKPLSSGLRWSDCLNFAIRGDGTRK